MFGWEFPPHILGGLGTASYGLTKGMSLQEDLETILVIPKPWGDEDQSFMKIIGANNTPVVWRDVSMELIKDRLEKFMEPQEYFSLRDNIYADFSYMNTNDLGCIEFSGRYPSNILEETNNYSIVAGVIARTYEFDVIHSHDWLTYPAGLHAKSVSGKPMIIHVHATEFDRSGGKPNPIVFEIEKNGMDNCDHIICVSELTRRTVLDNYHQPHWKVTTVHNAVEPLSPEIESIQRISGVSEKVVTFLGRITMQKGPEFFVDAATQVIQKTDHIRFVMAGSGDMMDQMIRLVAERGIAHKFHFTGFLRGKQVYEMLKSSDVYVMPSVSEPFGISPLEAMQCNVPSIISYQSGCSEILHNVIKTDYWDVDAMADAIYSICSYPAMSEHLKTQGKIEVDQIKWKDAGFKVRKIYDSLV